MRLLNGIRLMINYICYALDCRNDFVVCYKYDIILSEDSCEDDVADVFCDIIMTSMEKKGTPKAMALHFAGQRERYGTLKNHSFNN